MLPLPSTKATAYLVSTSPGVPYLNRPSMLNSAITLPTNASSFITGMSSISVVLVAVLSVGKLYVWFGPGMGRVKTDSFSAVKV